MLLKRVFQPCMPSAIWGTMGYGLKRVFKRIVASVPQVAVTLLPFKVAIGMLKWSVRGRGSPGLRGLWGEERACGELSKTPKYEDPL